METNMSMSLIPFVVVGLCCAAVSIGCVVLGYWMGRNTAGKPFNEFNPPIHQDKPPTSKAEPIIEYDPWAEALRDPKLDLKNTVK